MKLKTALGLAAALTAALLLSACGAMGAGGRLQTPEAEAPTVQTITPEEGKAMMEAGGVTVVDVRRADEYAAGHIPGAIHQPNEDIADAQPGTLPDLDAALIVYCRTGVRSQEAAGKLAAMGYTKVHDMGGITDWPYETVTGTELGTYPATADAADTEGTDAAEDPGEPAASTETSAETAQPVGILGSFSTTDLADNAVDQSVLADYKLTMVNVWATFCGPCLREMPDLGVLAAEYEARGVQFIGLVSDTLDADGAISDSQVSLAQDIVDQTGADYRHLLPSDSLMGLLSQIYAVPTTFFVDSEGRQVGTTYVRSMSRDQWVQVIDEVLAEVDAS